MIIDIRKDFLNSIKNTNSKAEVDKRLCSSKKHHLESDNADHF